MVLVAKRPAKSTSTVISWLKLRTKIIIRFDWHIYRLPKLYYSPLRTAVEKVLYWNKQTHQVTLKRVNYIIHHSGILTQSNWLQDHYQNVYPPSLLPVRKVPFFCDNATLCPAMAASWAGVGATPGGVGGITGCAIPSNLAPPSYPFYTQTSHFT